MYLLYLLLVEFAELPVILRLVADIVVALKTGDLHGVVQHQESALDVYRAYLRQIEQRGLDVLGFGLFEQIFAAVFQQLQL